LKFLRRSNSRYLLTNEVVTLIFGPIISRKGKVILEVRGFLRLVLTKKTTPALVSPVRRLHDGFGDQEPSVAIAQMMALGVKPVPLVTELRETPFELLDLAEILEMLLQTHLNFHQQIAVEPGRPRQKSERTHRLYLSSGDFPQALIGDFPACYQI